MANGSTGGDSGLELQIGRDPRVLNIPPYLLGYAGSTYVFQLVSIFGGVQNTVNATGVYDRRGRSVRYLFSFCESVGGSAQPKRRQRLYDRTYWVRAFHACL